MSRWARAASAPRISFVLPPCCVVELTPRSGERARSGAAHCASAAGISFLLPRRSGGGTDPALRRASEVEGRRAPHPRHASRSCSRGRRVEKLRPPHRLLRPALGPQPSAAVTLRPRFTASQATRVRGRCERDARRGRGVTRLHTAVCVGGRVRSGADAMRSTSLRCAAGKRARRFVAATSAIVIRVAEPHARRTCAPGTCRTHASLSRRGSASV